MCCRIFLTVFVIVQFVAVALTVIGTPIDMFRPKDSDYKSDTYCITLWGTKEKCFSTTYNSKTKEFWEPCTVRKSRFVAAQVCAIITIATFFLSLILALVQCCCCLCCKFVCMLLNIVGVVTGIVVFALMLDSWNNTRGPGVIPRCVAIKRYSKVNEVPMKIGAGLVLFIVSVALGFVNIFISLLPC